MLNRQKQGLEQERSGSLGLESASARVRCGSLETIAGRDVLDADSENLPNEPGWTPGFNDAHEMDIFRIRL